MNAACKKQRLTCWSIIIISEQALELADAQQMLRSTRSTAVLSDFLSALGFTGGLRGSRGRSPLVESHWSIEVPGELLMWRSSCSLDLWLKTVVLVKQPTNDDVWEDLRKLDCPLSTWGVWWLRCPLSLGQSHSWSNPRFWPEVS